MSKKGGGGDSISPACLRRGHCPDRRGHCPDRRGAIRFPQLQKSLGIRLPRLVSLHIMPGTIAQTIVESQELRLGQLPIQAGAIAPSGLWLRRHETIVWALPDRRQLSRAILRIKGGGIAPASGSVGTRQLSLVWAIAPAATIVWALPRQLSHVESP